MTRASPARVPAAACAPCPRRVLAGLAAAAGLALAACGQPTTPSDPGGRAAPPERTVTVLAASSLADVLPRILADVQASHPGWEVRTSFAGSSTLAAQVLAGAPADVLATASTTAMEPVEDAGATDGPARPFARNRLQLAVPAGNPGGVRGLDDLARPELTVALCAERVPCGAAARDLLASAGVRAAPDTLEDDVRAVLTKLELGEVDAGLVYRTDVRSAAGRVEGLDVPGAAAASTTYAVAVLADAADPEAARAVVEAVLSDAGQARLAAAGFDAP